VTDPAVEFIEANGIRFEVQTAGDSGSERLALCLHGFPESAESWRHQLPLLAELGYRVWAPNQRGYGRTTRPAQRADYHASHLLDDVAGLIDAAKARSVLLIAHDWGGLIGWLFALRRIRPLERFCVMNLPHPTLFLEHLEHNRAQRRRSIYERIFQLPRLPEWLFLRRGARAVQDAFRNMAVDKSQFPDDVLAKFSEQALQPGAMTAMLNWYRANPFREVCRGDFPVLDTPTLMIWGEHDAALGVEMTRGTQELVRDLETRYLNASHWVQQDAPVQTNAILRAWLTGEVVPTYPTKEGGPSA
jgi:pimeloyl-ACP methyl ester carboxylesterase